MGVSVSFSSKRIDERLESSLIFRREVVVEDTKILTNIVRKRFENILSK